MRVAADGRIQWHDGGEGNMTVTKAATGYYDITYPTNAASNAGPAFATVSKVNGISGYSIANLIKPSATGCRVRTSSAGTNSAAADNEFSFMYLTDPDFLGYDQACLNLSPLCHYDGDIPNTTTPPVDLVSNQVFTRLGAFTRLSTSVFNLNSAASYASNNSSNAWYQNYNPPSTYYNSTPTVAVVLMHRSAYSPQLLTAMSLEDNSVTNNGFNLSFFREATPFPLTPRIRIGATTINFTTEIPLDNAAGALVVAWLDPVGGWAVQVNNGAPQASGNFTVPTYTGTQRFWQANSRQNSPTQAFLDPIYRLTYWDKVLTNAERDELWQQLQ